MQERNINFYLDRAKEHSGFKSDLQLGQALGFKSSMVSYLRNGKSGISAEKMHALCNLAGIDPAVGLMDLAVWNSQGEAQKTYEGILKKISNVVLVLFAIISVNTPLTANASVKEHLNTSANMQTSVNTERIYYHILGCSNIQLPLINQLAV